MKFVHVLGGSQVAVTYQRNILCQSYPTENGGKKTNLKIGITVETVYYRVTGYMADHSIFL